ncbi:MAG TPA: error-prone DNA polymerase [Candidatus Sulfomarinibacteraceae bacterium]|nr:error-prone DNA polymerase [Candidatus Sulfomarinibacteraceae bacterium]
MYVELHAHSCFSLLDGASQPEDLVARAAEQGMAALALTDHSNVYGVHRFLRAAREHGVRPILGAELTLDGGHHLTLLVENQTGWHNLCYLISRAQHNAPKGEAMLPVAELEGCTDGLIALSGCRQGAIATALRDRKWRQAVKTARRYRTLFGPENFWIELQNHRRFGDALLVSRLADLAGYLQLGCVATNNVHYAIQERHCLQDVLVCIRHNTTLDQASHLLRSNSEYYLKPVEEMLTLFPDQPDAVANTLHLAERCQFEPGYGLQDLPRFETPHGMSAESYLRRLCQQGLREQYGAASVQARAQLQRELEVITQAGLANYFLIVWDIVRFARENGIRCQGRGSAANSLVAYLLHISPIDPLQHDLVFERFLSAERLSADAGFTPDIDMDFDAARREEVIQYVYTEYGVAHVAMACTFSTFRRKSAMRDVGKVLGLSPRSIAGIQRAVEEGRAVEAGSSADHLLTLAQQIEGAPRHLGIHSGGMILTGPPLMGRVPTEPAAMEKRVVVQWDKDDLEEAGLVKIDVLGLRMLSAISDTLAQLAQDNGAAPDLNALTFDDPAVYDMISAGDTIGVFQVESRAQTQLQPVLQPRCFEDLIVSIAIIRPGPIQGDMVHPYLRRRRGLEPVTYAHPLLEPALAETLGVILFQEQVLKVARDLAGFTPGQGEQLRRALSAKRATAAIDRLRDAFLAGAQAGGVSRQVAETVFDQLRAFGGYSFAKSHAAAFAVLVYQSAWLKQYHFLPFMAAVLNNQPMGFWSPSVIVGEVKRKGYAVLPVDIHHSQAQCTAEGGALRLGFNYVKGLGEAHVERIIEERRAAPFTSIADFWKRTRLGRRVTENLVTAGAMDGWELPRRHLLWELGTLRDQPGALDLDATPEAVDLPDLTPAEALLDEQAVLGLSAGEHIMTHVRPGLSGQGVLRTDQLVACRDGQRVHVAGLVVVHQAPPTAKGVHFVTLEDEQGMVDVIVWPQVYKRYRRVLHTARLLRVTGAVQNEGGNVNVLAETIVALTNVSSYR